jgi:hypothetical protein
MRPILITVAAAAVAAAAAAVAVVRSPRGWLPGLKHNLPAGVIGYITISSMNTI